MFLGAERVQYPFVYASGASQNPEQVYYGFLSYARAIDSQRNPIDFYVEDPNMRSVYPEAKEMVSLQDVVATIGRSGVSDPEAIGDALILMGLRAAGEESSDYYRYRFVAVFLGDTRGVERLYSGQGSFGGRFASVGIPESIDENPTGRYGAREQAVASRIDRHSRAPDFYGFYTTTEHEGVPWTRYQLGLQRLAVENFRTIISDLTVDNRVQYTQAILFHYQELQRLGLDPNAPREALVYELNQVYEAARNEFLQDLERASVYNISGGYDLSDEESIRNQGYRAELAIMSQRFSTDVIASSHAPFLVGDPIRFYPDINPVDVARGVFANIEPYRLPNLNSESFGVFWQENLEQGFDKWDIALARYHDQGLNPQVIEMLQGSVSDLIPTMDNLVENFRHLEDNGVADVDGVNTVFELSTGFSIRWFRLRQIEAMYDTVFAMSLQNPENAELNFILSDLASAIETTRQTLPSIVENTPEGARVIDARNLPMETRSGSPIRTLEDCPQDRAYNVIEFAAPLEAIENLREFQSQGNYEATVVRDGRGRVFLMNSNDARLLTGEVDFIEQINIGSRQASFLYGYADEPLPAPHGSAITHRTISEMSVAEMTSLLERRYNLELFNIENFSSLPEEMQYVVIVINQNGHRQILTAEQFSRQRYASNLEARASRILFFAARNNNRNQNLPVILPNRAAVINDLPVFLETYDITSGGPYNYGFRPLILYRREIAQGEYLYFAVPDSDNNYESDLLEGAERIDERWIPDPRREEDVRFLTLAYQDEQPTGRIEHRWDDMRIRWNGEQGQVQRIISLLGLEVLTEVDRRHLVRNALRARLDGILGPENNPLRNTSRYPRAGRALENFALSHLSTERGRINAPALARAIDATLERVEGEHGLRVFYEMPGQMRGRIAEEARDTSSRARFLREIMPRGRTVAR